MTDTRKLTTGACMLCAAIALALGSAARQAPTSDGVACTTNLKQLSTALAMYAQDYDEKLPPMEAAAAVQNRVNPYVRNVQTFNCPDHAKPYRPNSNVGGRALAAFTSPATAVTFYDPSAHADGSFGVAFLDGHVKRLSKVPSLVPALVAPKGHPGARKPHRKR